MFRQGNGWLYFAYAAAAAIPIWAIGSLVWSTVECNREGRALSRTLKPFLVRSIEISNRAEDHSSPRPFQLDFIADLLFEEGLEFVDVELPQLRRHYEMDPPVLDQLAASLRERGPYARFQPGKRGDADCIDRLIRPDQLELRHLSIPSGSCLRVKPTQKGTAEFVLSRRAYSRFYPLHRHYRDRLAIRDRAQAREVLSITFGAVDPLFGAPLRCPPHNEVGRDYRTGVYGFILPGLLQGPQHKLRDPIDFPPGEIRPLDLKRVTWLGNGSAHDLAERDWRSHYAAGAERLAANGFTLENSRIATANGEKDLQLLVSRRDGYKHRPPKAIAEAGVDVFDVLRVDADRVMFLARSRSASRGTYLIDIRAREVVHYLQVTEPNYEDGGCNPEKSYISGLHRRLNTMSIFPTFELEVVCVSADAAGSVSARTGRGLLAY